MIGIDFKVLKKQHGEALEMFEKKRPVDKKKVDEYVLNLKKSLLLIQAKKIREVKKSLRR